jgi:Fe-S cluster assembly protein SufB
VTSSGGSRKGSALAWKYPSCILRGDGSRGEVCSIAISNAYQRVDSGTEMVHLGKDTSSRLPTVA